MFNAARRVASKAATEIVTKMVDVKNQLSISPSLTASTASSSPRSPDSLSLSDDSSNSENNSELNSAASTPKFGVSFEHLTTRKHLFVWPRSLASSRVSTQQRLIHTGTYKTDADDELVKFTPKSKPITIDLKIQQQLLQKKADELLAEVEKNQVSGQYNKDDWKICKLSDLPDLIVQTSVQTPQYEKLSHLCPESYKAYVPKRGESQYFTQPTAFRSGVLSSNSLKLDQQQQAYHQYVQVDVPRCNKTGAPLFDHRAHLTVYHLAQLKKDCPDALIAVSTVMANTHRKIQLENGEEKQIYLGEGGVTQFFIPEDLSRVIKMTCPYKTISQFNGETQVYDRNRRPNIATHQDTKPSVIHVCPERIARLALPTSPAKEIATAKNSGKAAPKTPTKTPTKALGSSVKKTPTKTPIKVSCVTNTSGTLFNKSSTATLPIAKSPEVKKLIF